MTPKQATEKLFQAAQAGNVVDAQAAIDAQADLTARNQFAKTAHDLARAFGQIEIADMIAAAIEQQRHTDRVVKRRDGGEQQISS